MTKEDLLKPRKKVMIDFPQWSAFKHKKGDILTKKGIHWTGKGTARSINDNEIDNYPEIFRDMEWWEEREEKDMPEYVKCIKSPDNVHAAGMIYKVKWNSVWGYDKETEQPIVVSTNCYEPATKEEYESQNQIQ